MVARDHTLTRFRWGKPEVLVADAWALSVRPMDADKPKPLLEVIRNIDRQMSDLHFGKQTNEALFIGSWSTLRTWLITLGKLGIRTKTVPGLLIAEINIARYQARESKDK